MCNAIKMYFHKKNLFSLSVVNQSVIHWPIRHHLYHHKSSQKLIALYYYYCYFPVQTDHDECSASNPVCDDNAICQNNHGSYVCFCKAGFAGNGKTCDGKMSATLSTNRLHFAVRQFSNGLQMTSKCGNVVRRTKWHTRR